MAINVDRLRELALEIEYASRWEWDATSIVRRWQPSDGGWLYAYGVEGFAINMLYPAALWHWLPDQDNDGYWFAVLVSVDGSRRKPGRSASFVARQLLGLDREQAGRLFGAQSAEAARRIIAELVEAAESGDGGE